MDRGISLHRDRSIDIDVGIEMEMAIQTDITNYIESGIRQSIGMPIGVQKQLLIEFIGMLA